MQISLALGGDWDSNREIFVRTLFDDDDPAKTSIHVRCISESLKSFEKNLWKDAMNDDVLLQSIKLDYTKITVVQTIF